MVPHILSSYYPSKMGPASHPLAGVIKGAESVAPLSAASVICKCLLDDVMLNLDKQFPEYGAYINWGCMPR